MTDFQTPSAFTANANFDDFFNFEMLAGPSNSGPGSSSSRSSSNSPSTSFSALPPTPPNPFEMAYDPTSSFFNFVLDDELAKLDAQSMAPMTGAPADFMASFSPLEESSPESSTSPSSGGSPSTIDPQLVASPSTSKAISEFGGEEEEEHEEEEQDDEDDDDKMDTLPPRAGSKAGSRKGTVIGGGIVKKVGGKEKKDSKPSGMLSTTTMDPDDWRPTPEEYKKMSSKEKRQLRNKISARNFRVRRKEYINTLEGDIAERDRLIDAIRTELGSTKSENVALRQEITALKKALLEGNGDIPVLPPPAPLPAVSAGVLATAGLKSPPATPPTTKSVTTPNVHKDLPMSPRLAGRSFWGGNLGLGGITPVHTTLVPEISSVLSGKPASLSKKMPTLQENINPTLNNQSQPEKTMEISMPMTPFDSFTEMNPFTMKTLDAYRMHLWTRMAQQQHAAQKLNGSTSPQQHLTGLASNMRPHYFAKSPQLSAVLAGKSMSSAYPTPPASPQLLHTALPRSGSSKPESSKVAPTPQQAMLASMASQTLLSKLGGAFWDAFSGSSSSGPASQQVDTDKVRRVLEGKAVVRVVDVDTLPPPSTSVSSPASISRTPSLVPPALERPKCDASVGLEKMLGSLHL